MPAHPAPKPHGPIEEVFPNVFFVTGAFSPGPIARITRNMVVVRRGSELVVLNSVRLTPEGEAQLDRLGKVAHVVRLGHFHGADDPYYAERYNVPVWASSRIKHAPHVGNTKTLHAGDCPIDGASVYVCESGKADEAVVILDHDGGVMVGCDVLQNWTTFDGCSFTAKIFLPMMGFGPRCVGPIWAREMGPGVRTDLDRIAALNFRHYLPAHGTPIHNDGPDAFRTAVAKHYDK